MTSIGKLVRIVLISINFLAACAPSQMITFSPSEKAIISEPASTEIKAFVDQTDGACGYHMLRPQDWQLSENECRYYTYQNSANDRLELRVVNYQVMAQQMEGGTIAQYEAFKLDSSLEGWAAIMEQSWSSVGVKFTLIETLPQSVIYQLESPQSTGVELLALAVSENQPLGISLNAYGAYASLDSLEKVGLKADFITMVESIAAISHDPKNTEPKID